MITDRSLPKIGSVLLASALAVYAHGAQTDIATEPLNTYSAPSSTDVKPNVLFVLDDSGSMDWDFMPDWACAPFSMQNSSCTSTGQNPSSARSEFLFRNSSYNGVYYNPAITYKPPVAVDNTGALNTTTYPSMTGTSTATGADESATLPNWKAVKNDAYGVQSASTSNLMSDPNNPPYYFTTTAGEFCTETNLKTCSTTKSNTYKIDAKVRWCNSSDLTNCRAAFSSTYSYVRAPSPSVATITVGGSNYDYTSVSGITVNGQQIMAGATSDSLYYNTVAQRIVYQINRCTISLSGNCTVRGYHASRLNNDNVVTIIAPTEINDDLVITKSGPMTFDKTSFSKGTVPGSNQPTVITPAITSYPKADTRTDCASTTCTYAEEMTNYANWWTYYRTRMQMMKTAASNAFLKIDKAADLANNVSRFRLGYMSINNNTGSDFLNLGEFKTTQKYNWYSKLISATPNNSTPLRAALSKAGRLYAGKFNGNSLNGITVTDPLQYSCQQNYTILSTDGFWNEGSGYYKMDGSTNVGNQDGNLGRPYADGASTQTQNRESRLQSQAVTHIPQSSTSQLQRQISQLQVVDSRLQQRTLKLEKSTAVYSSRKWNWSAWTEVTSCTWDTKTSDGTQTQCRYATNLSGQADWSQWTDVSTCNAHAQDSSTSNGAVWSTAVQCQYAASTPVGVSSCTGIAQSTGPSYTVASARQCNTVTTSAYANVNSCTSSSTPDASGYTTQCRYTPWTDYADTPSCTAEGQSTESPYTVGTAVRCNTRTELGSWNYAVTCTKSDTQNCQYTNWSSWSNTDSCTEVAQSPGPTTYDVSTARQCQTLVTGGGTSNTLADVAAYYYNTDLRNPDAAQGTGTCTGPTIAPATTPNNLCTDNVPSNGLDVARTQHMTTYTLGLGAQGQMIYNGKDYWTETSGDFYDVKKGTPADPGNGRCSWQNSGDCTWPVPSSNSNANIDDLWHAAITGHGVYFSAKDPMSLATSLSSTLLEIANTPRPGTAAAAASSNPNVSASDNYVFSSSYKSVEWYGELIRQQINQDGTLTNQNWSAMKLVDCATTTWAASTSYVAGDVFRQGTSCYVVTKNYTSGASFDSSGIDGSNTAVIHADETASPKVAVTAPTSRTIYTKGTDGLISFEWDNLKDTNLAAYFTKPAIANLTQFCASGASCLSATAQDNTTIDTGGAAGQALVNFLRGDRSYENTYFRKRIHVLGDIVSAEARYVKVPMFSYTDANYAGYKKDKESRSGVVYVGANDGMLHAFDAGTGKELWAYIPSFVLPNLYKLADKNYANLHQYFVDGTPEVGDFCPKAPASTCTKEEWKTILVGGLNRGGKGYYALDITNPSSPALLWEFTNANLGYSYGNPKITKLKNGTWVVLVASGYNNADGVGHLYVLKASDGTLLRTISAVDIGTSDSPSGLARISAHVTSPMTDNTTVAAYGGDNFGNLWRFDVNGDIGADGYEAHLLVSLKDSSGNAQPITVKPLEATVNGKPVVFVGTGRYLGTTDVSDTHIQSFYAVKDKLDATTYGNPRIAATGFVQQVLTQTTCPEKSAYCIPGQVVRTVSHNPVDWTTKSGWYLDFLSAGERSSSDPSLGLGTLLFTTITPQSSSVSACGDPTGNGSASFAYALDYLTGGPVSGANDVAGYSLGNGLVTRPVLIEQSNGTVRALIRTSSTSAGTAVGSSPEDLTSGSDLGSTIVMTPPIKPTSAGTARRVSWRELNSAK